jgi:hypothetical protein
MARVGGNTTLVGVSTRSICTISVGACLPGPCVRMKHATMAMRRSSTINGTPEHPLPARPPRPAKAEPSPPQPGAPAPGVAGPWPPPPITNGLWLTVPSPDGGSAALSSAPSRCGASARSRGPPSEGPLGRRRLTCTVSPSPLLVDMSAITSSSVVSIRYFSVAPAPHRGKFRGPNRPTLQPAPEPSSETGRERSDARGREITAIQARVEILRFTILSWSAAHDRHRGLLHDGGTAHRSRRCGEFHSARRP